MIPTSSDVLPSSITAQVTVCVAPLLNPILQGTGLAHASLDSVARHVIVCVDHVQTTVLDTVSVSTKSASVIPVSPAATVQL